MQALFEKYGLTYVTGSLPRQVGSAWKKVIRLSLPNDFRARQAGASADRWRDSRRLRRRCTRGYGRSQTHAPGAGHAWDEATSAGRR